MRAYACSMIAVLAVKYIHLLLGAVFNCGTEAYHLILE
jgi:hypothetical protein